jgi:hypothetical protein
VPNYLGAMKRCVSHVTTRLRYVHKQEMEKPGSLKRAKAETTSSYTLEVYVTTVSIKLSVQNGVSDLNDLVSGEVLQLTKGS